MQRKNYYDLIRWMKRLRSAKNDQELRLAVLQVIKEMNRNANNCGLDPVEQMRLRNLVELPEDILMHYDS
jgi:hypothetical protein